MHQCAVATGINTCQRSGRWWRAQRNPSKTRLKRPCRCWFQTRWTAANLVSSCLKSAKRLMDFRTLEPPKTTNNNFTAFSNRKWSPPWPLQCHSLHGASWHIRQKDRLDRCRKDLAGLLGWGLFSIPFSKCIGTGPMHHIQSIGNSYDLLCTSKCTLVHEPTLVKLATIWRNCKAR